MKKAGFRSRTVAAFRPWEPLRLLIIPVVIAGLVALLWLALSQGFDVWQTLLVFVVALVYYLVRLWLGRWRMSRLFSSQETDARSRFVDLDLYIPIGDDRGGMISPKNAALGSDAAGVWLITFRMHLFATVPQDALRVPVGPEFRILSVSPARSGLLRVRASLMREPLEFVLLDDPALRSLLDSNLSPSPQKEE
ncbi:MAG TPA: hypothetical protein PLZ76_01785 [Bacillota bacterium]|nr:hypothetical protein [Bacillota bacterium]